MRRINDIIALLLIVFASVFQGCDKEEDTLAKAVLVSAGTLEFKATGAAEKIITVYADADWVSEAPDWITIHPSTGSGMMDVTVSVTDNIREGALDNIRKGTVVFKGGTLASRAELIVSQDGDKYRELKDYTLSELSALADETIVSVPNVTVMAITTTGFVVTDEQNKVNVLMIGHSAEPVALGDKITIKGSKLTTSESLVSVAFDLLTIQSMSSEVTYPEPMDITDKVDTYTSTSRDFISVRGLLNGTNVEIEGADYAVAIVEAPEELGLASLNGHMVTVSGYFAGVAAPVVKLMAATVKDQGVAEVIYFSDDFEWLQPWSEKSGAGQTVENDGTGSAPQIYTAKNEQGQSAAEALLEHGYGLEQIPGNAIYLQENYLKFGKTDFQAGLTLPAIANIPVGTKLVLSFDWAPMVGGSRKFDPVKLIVSIVNGDQIIELSPIEHRFVDQVDKLEWLHADVSIEGVSITKDTRISIKSDAWGENKTSSGSSVYRRWFIDNIKLVTNP